MNIFTLSSLHTIEATITIPTQGHFTRNEENVRLTYLVGSKAKYVVLPTRLETARVLYEMGFLDHYNPDNGEMYSSYQMYSSGHRGAVVSKEMRVHQPWEKLDITPAQALKICTAVEYDEMSLKDKIIKLLRA